MRPLTSENRIDCFVLDDILYDKSRSKKLELLAKVYDHVTHKYYKGFRDLKLAKEFQGRSFDMLNAHTTIVYVRYIMLALECRKSEDDRTMGELCYLMIDELNDIKYDESLKLIIESVDNAIFGDEAFAYTASLSDMTVYRPIK